MFVSTSELTEPHFVIGPVFAFQEISPGLLAGLGDPQAAFASTVAALAGEAKKLCAHGVVGAKFEFVDSDLTSVFSRLMGYKEQRICLFGYGTAIQLGRYLHSDNERLTDESYRLRIIDALRPKETSGVAASKADLGPLSEGENPVHGLRVVRLKGEEFYPMPDGRIRNRTPQGWVDFADWDAAKRYYNL